MDEGRSSRIRWLQAIAAKQVAQSWPTCDLKSLERASESVEAVRYALVWRVSRNVSETRGVGFMVALTEGCQDV